jgi:phosphoribosylaminoimidazole-succinocarboxamide synthase
MAFAEQTLAKIGADKTCAACDEKIHAANHAERSSKFKTERAAELHSAENGACRVASGILSTKIVTHSTECNSAVSERTLRLNFVFQPASFAAMNEPILQLDLPGINKVRSGKVREVFDLGNAFLLTATDRISAFDCVMPNGIPRKGEVLTQISHFWFEKFSSLVPNHLLAKSTDPLPTNLQPFADKLALRSMIVKKAQPLAIECIVRGYLSGSGWKEYKKLQTVCGIKLPAGLMESAELPEPIFTPSTKAESGHDENISFEEACKISGTEIATQARDLSLKIYKAGRDYARERGIIIADTKFEFGLYEGKLILIDEVLTPDSSRFWPANEYQPGKGQPSFDKQFVRDYLETLDWNKQPPAPALPKDVVEKTTEKYLEAFERLTGKTL